MTGRFFKTDDDQLMASDAAAEALMKRLDYGIDYEVEILFDQDEMFRRKLFATIGDMAKALWMKPDDLRAQLLFFTGNYRTVATIEGKDMIVLRSMARHGMSDRDMRKFWRKAQQVMRERVIPKLPDDLAQQIRGMLDG